jgi:sulfonate transport system substrate-binding protein
MTQNLWAEAVGEAPPPPSPSGDGGRRRRLWPILILVALVAGGVYAWVTRGNAADPGVLHVGSQRGGTKAVMLASHALDGAAYRVEWSEFPAAQNLLEAIGAGAVDVGLVGDAPFQFAYQTGSPIKAVAAQAAPNRPQGALSILVPARSPIRSVADLKGKRIATTRGSVGHYLILRALEANGLKSGDVRIVFLSPGDTKAAFDSGSIDAWSTWSPYTATALTEGARIVADGSAYLTGYGFDAANAQAAVAKRVILADFLQREAKALLWAKAHPQDYAAVLAHETGLPLPIARFTVDHNQRIAVPIDDALKAEERDVVTHFRTAGALAGNRPLDEAYLPLDQGGANGH